MSSKLKQYFYISIQLIIFIVISINLITYKMKTNLFLFITHTFIIIGIICSYNPQRHDTLFSNPDSNLYSVVNKTITSNSFVLTLKCEHQKQLKFIKTKNDGIQYIGLEIFFLKKNTVQFIFRDLNEKAFEMPHEEPFPFHNYQNDINKFFNLNPVDFDYELIIDEDPFSLSILRKSTKEVVFSSVDMDIILRNNYAEISTVIPSENLFGLGERTTNFKIKSGIYTMYNKDIYGELEDGKGRGIQRYGSHPMYLMREKSGKYHISYLRNSLPMDVIVNHDDSIVTYKIAGGILDFTFFFGDENPENVIKTYHKYLGGYSMPPFWSFGFHQSRWGYDNVKMFEEVLTKYKQLNLPLDVIWNDIDYMIDHQSFTVDTNRFNLEEFRNLMNLHKKKYVMISEPTIGIKWDKFEYLKKGIELDIFIKNEKGQNLLNRVWPGRCHFIDFFNPKSKIFWEDAMTALHKNLTYDGVWLDMNEIAAFEAGQVDRNGYKISCEDKNIYPYIPGKEPFESKTLCPNAVHHNGLKHIQVHNYYPNMQAKRTYDLLEKLYPDQFPFILTRANGPGIGKYAAHWSGDNYGRFSFYQLSVSEVFNFNLYGAPMVGADICGFGENTPEVLCAKWYQMGSLYPFSRSHAHNESYRKEPFAMGPILLETTLKSLQFRYSILKYYYSLFMLNNGTGTIFRPLFFEFYDDIALLENENIQNSFMIGSSLLAVPNFNDSDRSYTSNAYFPKGDWYDLRTSTRVNKVSEKAESIKIENALRDMPPVFLRSGKIIFTNDIVDVRSTVDLNNAFSLLIAFNSFDKDSESKISLSTGVIPALNNYHSRKSVESCMQNDCYVKITSDLDYDTNILKLSFSKAKYYDYEYTYLLISELKVFGVNLNKISKTLKSGAMMDNDKFLKTNEELQYEIKVLNENCITLKFKESIKIMKEELSYTFKLE